MRDLSDSSATIISGYLTTEQGAETGYTTDSSESTITTAENLGMKHPVNDKQTTRANIADEKECIDANHPTISQLEHHEEVYTSKSSSDEMIENDSSCSDDCASSSCTSEVSSSGYCPTPVKRAKVSPVELGNRILVCQTVQLNDFLHQVNTTSLCYTPNCVGKLVPVSIKQIGLGGSLLVKFSCTGCCERMLSLKSSVEIEFSKRTACSLAIQVAFITAGCMHAQYSKVLKQHLGMSAVNSTTFYETIKLLEPVVSNLLLEMCTVAKNEMRALDPSVVGS